MSVIFSALKPTVGKTIVSILCALFVAVYLGIVGFTGGLFFGTVEAGIQAPVEVTKMNAEVWDAGIEGRDPELDTQAFEDAAKRPVEMGAEYAFSGFFKTFLWIYGIWSAIQLIGLVRKK